MIQTAWNFLTKTSHGHKTKNVCVFFFYCGTMQSHSNKTVTLFMQKLRTEIDICLLLQHESEIRHLSSNLAGTI